MNKMKIAALAAGVLILAGCGNKTVNNSETGVVTEPDQTKMENKLEAKNESGGIISSIKDAMGLGQTMRCAYQIKNGEGSLETVTYVNGQKYMTETAMGGNVQKIIFDGETMYSWSEKDKKGTKFTKTCMEELAQNAPQASQGENAAAPDPTGEKNFDNAMDVKCEAAAGVDFSIPTDVTFADQCEMMKNLLKNVPNVPTSMLQSPSL